MLFSGELGRWDACTLFPWQPFTGSYRHSLLTAVCVCEGIDPYVMAVYSADTFVFTFVLSTVISD